jgi:hypothetical protein
MLPQYDSHMNIQHINREYFLLFSINFFPKEDNN